MSWREFLLWIIGVGVIIPLVMKARDQLEQWLLKRETATLKLEPSERLLEMDEVEFGVLHVRDGKDQVEDSGELLNEKLRLQETENDRAELAAKIAFRRELGFQFKFFVDCDDVEFGTVAEPLRSDGYKNVNEAESTANRVFFLHPDFPTCETTDGHINNFYYPAKDTLRG